MSGSFLFTDKDNLNNFNTSSLPTQPSTENTEEEEEKQDEPVHSLSELTLNENDSFLAILRRLCIYWRRILSNKIRLIFTLIFMSMLNITARITCFTRHRAPPPSASSSPFSATVTSSSIQPFEKSAMNIYLSITNNNLSYMYNRQDKLEDLNDSSKALLLIDKQPIDLPSLENSKMAHLLVQQQTTHRSSNINIHRSTQKDSPLPVVHSVDERLFLQDSTRLLHLLKRFASEPHMSKYDTQSVNSNGHIENSPVVFALSSPLQYNESEKDDILFDDILDLNCDKIQPVSTSLTEDLNSDKIDNIITTNNPSSEQITPINDEFKSLQLNEDVLFDTSPTINGNDISGERHFRRRKRRSSLTRNSISLDDTQVTVDLLEKSEINQEIPEENNEKLELKADDQETNGIETKPSENEESNQTITDDEKSASVSRYRGRRLRHRFHRHSTSQEVISNTSPEFYLPNEVVNDETPRTYSPPPLSPVPISPLPSPTSPTLTNISNPTTPNTSTAGALKRINSVGTAKKNVRFADSVGRELAQVQYIRSSIYDDSQEFSFLLGSSLLSSSPPSFTKNNLYLPNKSRLEHKPWSFDVASTTNKQTNQAVLPRRFFCLYRQPSSEHPDIYLHEVWKSQIKLEYADIPLKCSSTGEQQLTGTLWVTNASFWKYVTIKYTFNRWLNTYEHEAKYRCHSNDFRNIDQFEFAIDIPADVDRIDFILRYCVNGQEHWDNNEGINYTLQTESAYTPSTTISLPHDCDFDEMRFY